MNLERIRKLANAASKGNWTAFTKGTTVAVLNNNNAKNTIIEWNGFDSSSTSVSQQKTNAKYIVAVQPKTVLELLKKIDAENKDGYNAAVMDIVNFMDSMDVDAETIKEQFLSA